MTTPRPCEIVTVWNGILEMRAGATGNREKPCLCSSNHKRGMHRIRYATLIDVANPIGIVRRFHLRSLRVCLEGLLPVELVQLSEHFATLSSRDVKDMHNEYIPSTSGCVHLV